MDHVGLGRKRSTELPNIKVLKQYISVLMIGKNGFMLVTRSHKIKTEMLFTSDTKSVSMLAVVCMHCISIQMSLVRM